MQSMLKIPQNEGMPDLYEVAEQNHQECQEFNLGSCEGLEDPLGLMVDRLLLPHVKVAKVAYHYEQQEKRCYYCDKTGHFSWNCPKHLQALKIKK